MKNSVSDLALFGGSPLFGTVRPTGQLAVPDSALFFKLLERVYDSRRFTNNGSLVCELEARLGDIHGASHCLAFGNACFALMALMRILSAGKHGEVLIPSFTYRGIPHFVCWAGQTPRFCDSNPETHTLDPKSVAASITEETTAILAVHHVNSPCNISEFKRLSEQTAIPIIYDSVYGQMSTYRNCLLGGFGEAEVFSLHATKLINGFEGGYITTNNEKLAEQLRKIRTFGFVGKDRVESLGLNAKLNELHAAMALASLENLNEVIEGNRQRYEAYRKAFRGMEGVSLVPFMPGEQYNYSLFIMEILDDSLLKADVLQRIISAENVSCNLYYSPPLHQVAPWKNTCNTRLPVAEALSGRFVKLPAGDMVSVADIEQIADLYRFVYKKAQMIVSKMGERGWT